MAHMYTVVSEAKPLEMWKQGSQLYQYGPGHSLQFNIQ